MRIIETTRRRIVVVVSCLLTALATAPAAVAVPVAGTGAHGPGAARTGDWDSLIGTSPGEPLEVVRTVTETVSVGVPYLAAVAIGLLAFATAWILATYVANHRATMG